MGLEDVKSDILNEAEQESNRIVEEAEEEAEEIIEEAEEEAESIREQAEKEIEEKEESIKRKALSSARMKAKQVKLREKQKHLDTAFRDFREKLEDLADDEKEAFVESCLDRASFEVGTVRGGEEFSDAVSKDFEEADIDGIILESEDGERRMDFTFDRIVEDYRENHRREVAEALFE
ncbi:MAG: V-type ATP synthase subunit E family protein [Candidatus Nanohaloarchaea archaeon]